MDPTVPGNPYYRPPPGWSPGPPGATSTLSNNDTKSLHEDLSQQPPPSFMGRGANGQHFGRMPPPMAMMPGAGPGPGGLPGPPGPGSNWHNHWRPPNMPPPPYPPHHIQPPGYPPCAPPSRPFYAGSFPTINNNADGQDESASSASDMGTTARLVKSPNSFEDQKSIPPDSGTLMELCDSQVETLALHKTTTSEASSSEDQNLINNWLSNKGIHIGHKSSGPMPSSTALKKMTVAQAKQLLQRVSQLTSEIRCLDSQSETSEEKLSKIKEQLFHIRGQFSEAVVDDLKMKLSRIAKKRAGRKRRQERAWQEQQEVEEKRQKLHQDIDSRLQAVARAENQAKREKQLKEAADETVGEVRKKLTEAKRCLDLLKALQKLRMIRKDSAARKGLLVPQYSDETFTSRLTQLTRLVQQQIETYQAEDKALQVMLDFEKEETKEKDRERKQRQVAKQEERLRRLTERYLFGATVPTNPSNPRLAFKPYYDAAEQSLTSFLTIRNEWDMYRVVPGQGSRPPPHWVSPPPPSSEVWASALKSAQEL